MAVLLLALGGLAVVFLAVRWFLRANPSTLARGSRRILLVLGGFAIGVLLILSIRFLPELLPELLGLAGLLGTTFLARLLRRRPAGGFGTPGAGARTEVRTAFLRAWIDQGSAEVGGAVVAGRFSGRTLESLAEGELLDLLTEVSVDRDSSRVLETYLDRRLGSDWRGKRQSAHPAPKADLSRGEALAVLGLPEGATASEIQAAHRRLIQRVHPDVGGSADLAARINRAKEVLLG
jgi:hypothetical protein